MKSKDISLILDLRMPLFLADFTLLEIGKGNPYFDVERTEASFKERWEKTILPFFETAESLRKSRKFKYSIFFSGNFLTLLKKHYPEEIDRIQKLTDKGAIELIGGSYSNSLASLFSMDVFEMDILRHKELLKKTFGQKSPIFLNTENIFSNPIAVELKTLGFKATFTDHIPWYLNGKHPRQVFKGLVRGDFKVMIMEHASMKLLEDQKEDEVKFVKLIPYAETQGKNWKDRITALIDKHNTLTVSEALENKNPKNKFSAPIPIGGLARTNGLDGLIQHPMQKKSLETLFSIEEKVLKNGDQDLINDWISLSNVEYLLGMNMAKSEGTRPYDIFIRYMNILTDLNMRIS